MISALGYPFLTDELERKEMAIGERRLWQRLAVLRPFFIL